MAEHLHTRIAQAVRDALDGSSTSWVGGAVFPYRTYPVDGSTLPYTCAWAGDEDVQRESGGDDEDKTVEAELEVLVAGFLTGSGEARDALIGQHLKQVQSVMAQGIEIDGVAVAFDYRGCTKRYEGADEEYTEVLMRFVAEIAYQQDDPTTLSWQ